MKFRSRHTAAADSSDTHSAPASKKIRFLTTNQHGTEKTGRHRNFQFQSEFHTVQFSYRYHTNVCPVHYQ